MRKTHMKWMPLLLAITLWGPAAVAEPQASDSTTVTLRVQPYVAFSLGTAVYHSTDEALSSSRTLVPDGIATVRSGPDWFWVEGTIHSNVHGVSLVASYQGTLQQVDYITPAVVVPPSGPPGFWLRIRLESISNNPKAIQLVRTSPTQVALTRTDGGTGTVTVTVYPGG
jgi:hypothetical protein